MAYVFTNTQKLSPTTATAAMYNLIFTGLITNGGWTLMGAGDGVSNFNNSGAASSVITSSGSGANGFNNNSAWVRIQMPGGSGREMLFQRGSASGRNWWIRYSFSAGFTGTGNGTVSATVSPTASDQQNILSASSTGTECFINDTGFSQNVGVNSAYPYGFYSFCYPTGGGEVQHLSLLDPIIGDAQDPDPYIFLFTDGNVNANHIFPMYGANLYYQNCALVRPDQSISTYGLPIGWMRKGTTAQGFVTFSASQNIINTSNATWLGMPGYTDALSSAFTDDLYPVYWARVSNALGGPLAAPTGVKGQSSTLYWLGSECGTGLDILSVNSTGDYIILNGIVALPWNGTVLSPL